MARATTKTFLSLDRWSQIFGIEPLHFNQLHSNTIQGAAMCGSVWYQFAWQEANHVSREDVALAISIAESRIIDTIGYDLLPNWNLNENVLTTRPAVPESFSSGLNVRGRLKSVRANKAHVISGGIRVSEAIEENVIPVRSDSTGDGYEDLVTLTVATTVTDCNEIHVYYAGKNGSYQWEIRPITVAIAAGIATITFYSWQIVDPDLQDGYDTDPIDADDPGSYVRVVDVYRVYNDPGTQVQFLWEPGASLCDCGSSDCPSCSFYSQYGCLTIRNNRLGIFAYRPATWDVDAQAFTVAEYSIPRDPDRLRLSYLAGWQSEDADCPYVKMDPFWENAVAYYAASLLDRGVCECNNVSNFIDHWKTDLAKQTDAATYTLTPEQANNPFGTTRGALFARRCCLDPGRRIAQ